MAVSRAVLVTGCSSGIGRATAERLAAAGFTVYASARRLDAVEGLAGCRPLQLDVTDEASMRAAVAQIEQDEGAVGVLVNNAGYSQSGAVEGVPPAEAHRQLETNVFGPMRLTQLVLPGMREQRWGRIVNVSSMGGELTFPGGGWYHASKHALEALSDALRFELAGFGIDVVVIQPVLALYRLGAWRWSGYRTCGGFERGGASGAVEAGSRAGSAAGRRRAKVIERAVTAKTAAHALPGDTVGASLHHAARLSRRSRLGRARRPQLPEAVGAREALREEPDEQRGGQADDVEVVAFDPLDERRAAALDRVRRPPAPPTRRARDGARARAGSAPGR